MIISKQNGKLVLVRQDEHMLHAGEITKQWGNEFVEKPSPNDSVILAISQHDLGWLNPDDEILFDEEKGQPVGFINVNVKQHVEFYEKGFKQVVKQDPYAGMLLGMHWIGLYISRFGYDPTFTYTIPEELRSFMNETIVSQEKKWVDIKYQLWSYSQSRREFEDQIWLHYELFQVMDRLSLFICLNDHEKVNETTLGPIRFTKEGEYHYLTVKTTGKGEVQVSPFPFDEAFEVSVPLRRIPDKRYTSHEELKETFNTAPIEILTCKIIPG